MAYDFNLLFFTIASLFVGFLIGRYAYPDKKDTLEFLKDEEVKKEVITEPDGFLNEEIKDGI